MHSCCTFLTKQDVLSLGKGSLGPVWLITWLGLNPSECQAAPGAHIPSMLLP